MAPKRKNRTPIIAEYADDDEEHVVYDDYDKSYTEEDNPPIIARSTRSQTIKSFGPVDHIKAAETAGEVSHAEAQICASGPRKRSRGRDGVHKAIPINSKAYTKKQNVRKTGGKEKASLSPLFRADADIPEDFTSASSNLALFGDPRITSSFVQSSSTRPDITSAASDELTDLAKVRDALLPQPSYSTASIADENGGDSRRSPREQRIELYVGEPASVKSFTNPSSAGHVKTLLDRPKHWGSGELSNKAHRTNLVSAGRGRKRAISSSSSSSSRTARGVASFPSQTGRTSTADHSPEADESRSTQSFRPKWLQRTTYRNNSNSAMPQTVDSGVESVDAIETGAKLQEAMYDESVGFGIQFESQATCRNSAVSRRDENSLVHSATTPMQSYRSTSKIRPGSWLARLAKVSRTDDATTTGLLNSPSSGLTDARNRAPHWMDMSILRLEAPARPFKVALVYVHSVMVSARQAALLAGAANGSLGATSADIIAEENFGDVNEPDSSLLQIPVISSKADTSTNGGGSSIIPATISIDKELKGTLQHMYFLESCTVGNRSLTVGKSFRVYNAMHIGPGFVCTQAYEPLDIVGDYCSADSPAAQQVPLHITRQAKDAPEAYSMRRAVLHK